MNYHDTRQASKGTRGYVVIYMGIYILICNLCQKIYSPKNILQFHTHNFDIDERNERRKGNHV